jgi:Flp pilus assembly pilin Flp
MLRRIFKDKMKWYRRRRRREDGQAITEYGAIIAFVACLVALLFASSTTGFGGAVSSAYSSICNQLNNMSTTAGSSS